MQWRVVYQYVDSQQYMCIIKLTNLTTCLQERKKELLFSCFFPKQVILNPMKKGVKILGMFFLLLFLLLGAGIIYYREMSSPVGQSTQKVSFVVPKGRSIIWMGNSLQEKGLIRSAQIFRFEVWRLGLATKLQAGTFEISPNMTTASVAEALTKGTNDVWITLLEGWRKEEIAEAFSQALGESFDQSEFLRLAEKAEGRLFPETYLIPKSMTANQAFSLLTSTFKKQLPKDWDAQLTSAGRTEEEAIIMASLIQREAKTLPTMRMISDILWKRINAGWPLQVDATLQYVKGYSKSEKTWWPTPLASYKDLVSPFNTYKNIGLPPAPICNPGLDALKAAADPEANEYWFYISDLQGQMHYAKTLPEHNANVDRYLR